MTTRLYIRICDFLREHITGTRWEGHIYTVGGCCRDLALGQEIKDVDLAVDLPNGGVEFAQWLYQERLATGRPTLFERYGTAMLRLRAFPHDDVEIVQTRAEKYTDHNSRNPQTAFGSLEEDCMRRDLTINALYYDITARKLLDITGRSLADIKSCTIATPLDPDSTYDDDPVRILRTVRFACRLGWELPTDIFDAMCRNSARLNIIKPERLRGEFEKILLGANAGRALDLLHKCGAMNLIAPAVVHTADIHYLPESDDTAWHRTTRAVDLLPADLTLRWAALLCDSALPSPAHARLSTHAVLRSLMALKYHQPLLKDVLFLCANHEYTAGWGEYAESMKDSALRRLQFLSGRQEKLDALLTLIDALNKALPLEAAMPEQVSYIRMRERAMTDEGTAMYSFHLPFAERRIKKILHIEPGPLVEDTLEYMMELAFANPRRSRQEYERLVSKYTPKPHSGDTVPLSEEIRPSAKKPRAKKADNKNNVRTQERKSVRMQQRRHHNRRRKSSNNTKTGE